MKLKKNQFQKKFRFKRDGWYREHLFKVPYDSQPVFFLYPKGKYRKKIKKLISKNFSEIRKIGEKTLELAGAYAQIGVFLNELQGVINQNRYGRYSGFNYGNRNPYGEGFIRDQLVERLAQSFNITLPRCWRSGGGNFSFSNDFVSRAQCVAKNVRLEDFDLSVSRMLQQGGLLAATKLVEKYPQLAYWINVAAAAADLILKILKKTPLRIVPTLPQVRGNLNNRNANNRVRTPKPLAAPEKISLFAEKPPTDSNFVTAFPIVMHKWQADPDPDVISLPIPSLFDPCAHIGQNLIKNTDISYDWLRDPFARDFRLIIGAEKGFTKEFTLRKNMGLSGWILNINQRDLQSFPKVKMELKAKMVATRGFSNLESKEFSIPISGSGRWEIPKESSSRFSVGGKRKVVIRNSMGSCRCLQSVTLRPSSGGEFTFEANSRTNPLMFNESGTEAWFEIDTTHFQPGQNSIELWGYGSRRPQNLSLNLFPKAPEIKKLIAHRGDSKVTIEGDRIGQITGLRINGKQARPSQLSGNNRRQNGNGRVFVFQNSRDRVLSNKVSLEMQLGANRKHKSQTRFEVKPARPAIQADKKREVEAVIIGDKKTGKFDLSSYPVAPADIEKMSISVKTTLADYSFRAEDIQIETKIENGQVRQNTLPKTNLEVLDSLHLKIDLQFNPRFKKFLAGRRLQFRIKDRQRGDSDWYSIKQTFVRIPKIESIICRGQECKITGTGLDYIGQVSTDGGNVWQPPLQVQPTPNGKSFMSIQGVKMRNLIRIKLRDFPSTEGLRIE